MAQSESFAIAEGKRAVDVVGASVRDAADSLSRASVPVNDVESGSRGLVAFDDMEDRFQQAFERTLQGPLSQIIVTAGMLEPQLGGSQVDRLRDVTAAARRHSDMLRDMFAFVRTSMWGGVQVERRRVDLRLLCERFLDAFQARHPDRAIALVSRTRIEGQWDPDLVVSLLSHLVTNAVEHGSPNKVVRIAVRAVDDSVVIEVTNVGPALDQEVVGRLFEPFNCGPSRRPGSEGLGLGLFLASEIARAHSGRIDPLSDPARGTTTFRVTLPRS
jgi:signal transduction histidine kinase